MKNTKEIYRIANDLVKEVIDRTETFGEALLVADAIKNMMVFKEMFIRDELIKKIKEAEK